MGFYNTGNANLVSLSEQRRQAQIRRTQELAQKKAFEREKERMELANKQAAAESSKSWYGNAAKLGAMGAGIGFMAGGGVGAAIGGGAGALVGSGLGIANEMKQGHKSFGETVKRAPTTGEFIGMSEAGTQAAMMGVAANRGAPEQAASTQPTGQPAAQAANFYAQTEGPMSANAQYAASGAPLGTLPAGARAPALSLAEHQAMAGAPSGYIPSMYNGMTREEYEQAFGFGQGNLTGRY